MQEFWCSTNCLTSFSSSIFNSLLLIPHNPSPTNEDVDNERNENESIGEDSSVDGPDTSSFTAFLYSLLSSESASDLNSDDHDQIDHKTQSSVESLPDAVLFENVGKKSMLSRGKQSLNKAVYRAVRIGGYSKQSSGHTGKSQMGVDEEDGSKLVEIQSQSESMRMVNLPDISEPSVLLSDKLRSALYSSLPALVQGRKWVLLYSTWRHGISLSSLYRRSMLWPGLSLLVVGDREDSVFGGLVEAPLRPSTKKKYQGTNSTFVFTNTSGGPVIFRPTGVNRYYTLCSTEFLALGGGGHFALYLDSDLLTGSSSVSDTYGNSCLANSESFEVKEVENEDVDNERNENESIGEDSSVDGPDTSSFTAFLYSLLSSESASDLNSDDHDQIDHKTQSSVESLPDAVLFENVGKKSMLSRGKQSLNKAVYRAVRIGGYSKQSSGHTGKSQMGVDEEDGSKLVEIQSQSESMRMVNLPDISEPSVLLSDKLRSALYSSLPALVQGRKWVLLYSTWRHGISLSSLYRRSMLWPGLSLLVVGDREDSVFGGLVEAPLRPSTKKKYQGTNSTFVFTNTSGGPVIFRPTGVNRYYTLCSSEFLALGGGGHFALYLDSDLLTGSSSVSDTYGNSCLANSESFEVKEVELWGFVYGSKYEEIVESSRTEAPGICRW